MIIFSICIITNCYRIRNSFSSVSYSNSIFCRSAVSLCILTNNNTWCTICICIITNCYRTFSCITISTDCRRTFISRCPITNCYGIASLYKVSRSILSVSKITNCYGIFTCRWVTTNSYATSVTSGIKSDCYCILRFWDSCRCFFGNLKLQNYSLFLFLFQ